MVYVELMFEVPRTKVQQALQSFKNTALRWDKEYTEKLGGKLIGCWYTAYGKVGEITLMVAYPTLESREQVLQAFQQDAAAQQEAAEWFAYSPNATIRVLRPAFFSPLQ